jgi:hypothetical protein
MRRRGAIDFVAAQQHLAIQEADGCIAFLEENRCRWGVSLCDTVEVLYACFWSAGMQVLLCVDGRRREAAPNGGRAGQLIGALLMPMVPPCSQLGLVMGGARAGQTWELREVEHREHPHCKTTSAKTI